jgi:hypothetical protein
MYKEEISKEPKLSNSIIRSPGSLLPLFPTDPHPNVSHRYHAHIVSTVTYRKSNLVWAIFFGHLYYVGLLLRRDSASHHYLRSLANFH